jgi:hypothetical protein
MISKFSDNLIFSKEAYIKAPSPITVILLGNTIFFGDLPRL